MKIKETELKKTFEKYCCNPPDKTELGDIVFHTNKRYYEQLIRRFPRDYAAIVLKHFEERENYEICHIIFKKIKEYNKINNDNIKTNLDECR